MSIFGLHPSRVQETAPYRLVLQTARLFLRELNLNDAQFILNLLNEPAFVRFIGDKRVRSPSDARDYLAQGPLDSYERHGFGLLAVCVHAAAEDGPIGICGLVKREGLDDPDVGFAFLEQHRSRGYAAEAASAIVTFAMKSLQLPRILAITSPDNIASIAVLKRIGMRFERRTKINGASTEVNLFSIHAATEETVNEPADVAAPTKHGRD